ncbi:MAG: YkgJ family cysteine cluster protein [Natronospirillum sp.]|uniref:YkgJ family cysteine cluster protein n=1 Tax=Natronospirillum sp. TaxID=2812955 RepID=UPI0025EBFEB3|nr:YkgJ family cysteine cluster protein [Natronospirillum sp.]MCH8550473.1 YkgJ family cysteine cluster protein [Natronospirillum sp.]
MICRDGCGACCIAPTISSPLPGMPDGKPAGVPCIHLLEDWRCALFGSANRPQVCSDFAPDPVVCGNDRWEALRLIGELEIATQNRP